MPECIFCSERRLAAYVFGRKQHLQEPWGGSNIKCIFFADSNIYQNLLAVAILNCLFVADNDIGRNLLEGAILTGFFLAGNDIYVNLLEREGGVLNCIFLPRATFT